MADILGLAPYFPGTAGGQRTTIECWSPLLAQHGINVHLAPFESPALHAVLYEPGHNWAKGVALIRAYWDRLLNIRSLKDYDAVFVYREAALVGPEVLERLVLAQGLPLIYCLDDPLFVPYRSPQNGILSRLKFPGKVARLCSHAKAVVVNGNPLRRFAEQHNPNVWVIPNLVDEKLYIPQTTRQRSSSVVGWIGSHSSDTNLDLLAEPLAVLAERMDFELRLVGTDRTRIGRVRGTPRPWSAETEVEELRRFDVGLLPLTDHPWNPWKFNFKLAQYMALGVPPVCSPQGSNTEIIQPGITGYLADSTEAWVDSIGALLSDEQHRQKVGMAAAQYAMEHFTLSSNAETIVGLFHSVLQQSSYSAAC